MKEDTCLHAGGASRRGRAAPSLSHRLSVRVLTCAGALLALYGAAPVHALSGFPDTRNIGFFTDPDEPEKAKLYCDWRFTGTSRALAACAQRVPEVVAVQVPIGLDLAMETGTTISSTRFGGFTISTKDVGQSTARVALICETAGSGTGLNHCLRITQGAGGGPSQCLPKFFSITTNAAQCAADLVKLQNVFGKDARIAFTRDRNANDSLNVNICTPASWVCGAPPSILTGLGNREIQGIGLVDVETPHTCQISDTTYTYNPPPTPPHEPCP